MLILLANQSAAGALMTEVASWSTTDDSNVDIFPEGMYLGQVNNAGRAMQGALARQFNGTGTKYIAPVGSAALPSYTFASSTTTGWSCATANTPVLSIAGAEALRIDSSSRVLVNTTSTFSTSARLQILLSGSGSTSCGIAIQGDAAGGAHPINFHPAGSSTPIGSIAYAGATSVNYNTTSDARLKNVIGPVASGDLIDALNPIRFEWKHHPNEPARNGFIAQELVKVVPEVVTPGDTGDVIETPWMVDVSGLIPVVVSELKALRKRVSSLEARADQSPNTLPGERII
jgi:hypothetical protein